MSCDYNCENNCEECDFPDMVMEYVKGYNQALKDMAEKIKEYSGEHYLDCDGYGYQTELVFRTEEFLDDVLSELKK